MFVFKFGFLNFLFFHSGGNSGGGYRERSGYGGGERGGRGGDYGRRDGPRGGRSSRRIYFFMIFKAHLVSERRIYPDILRAALSPI